MFDLTDNPTRGDTVMRSTLSALLLGATLAIGLGRPAAPLPPAPQRRRLLPPWRGRSRCCGSANPAFASPRLTAG